MRKAVTLKMKYFNSKKKNVLNETKICFANRKRRICLKGTIFVSFNFRLN